MLARSQHPNWYLRGFCYEKKQQAKNLETKKFLWLTGTTFGRPLKYDSRPFRRTASDLADVSSFR
jgi:hypothetical protein